MKLRDGKIKMKTIPADFLEGFNDFSIMYDATIY